MKRFIINSIFIGFFLSLTSLVFAYDITVGNDTDLRTNLDTYKNFVIVDTNRPVSGHGYLTRFEYNASNLNPFKFMVVDQSKKVKWVSEEITPDATGSNVYKPIEGVWVEDGWNVGLYFTSTGTISYKVDSSAQLAYYTANNYGKVAVNNPVPTAGTTKRFYSFVVYGWLDTDMDGVYDDVDMCENTDTDTWSVGLGVNRWEYSDGSGDLGWYQNQPVKKGKGTTPVFMEDLSYTYGCSGAQILDLLNEAFGDAMNGHWKFGLSSSVVEEFHLDYEDGELDGMYQLGTFEVPVTNGEGVMTDFETMAGTEYHLKAMGTYRFVNWPGEFGIADAEYSNRIAGHSPFGVEGWFEGEDFFATKYPGMNIHALDILVNGGNVDWGTFSDEHVYHHELSGNGNKLKFSIYDNAYGDNSYNDPSNKLRVAVYGIL